MNLWILLRSFIILLLLSYTTVVTVQHIEKDIMVENFKKRGVFQEDISTKKFKYYKIDYEGKPSLSFLNSSADCYPGNVGDILISCEQNTIHPLVNGVISYYAGGHAGYITGPYRDDYTYIGEIGTVEATMTVGNNADCGVYSKEDWRGLQYFNEVMCLRVDMTDEELARVTASITSRLGDPYNETFFFNIYDTSYCSDVVSKSFECINRDLNPTKLTTSMYDMITAKDTYISYYHYVDSDGVKHIYYLG